MTTEARVVFRIPPKKFNGATSEKRLVRTKVNKRRSKANCIGTGATRYGRQVAGLLPTTLKVQAAQEKVSGQYAPVSVLPPLAFTNLATGLWSLPPKQLKAALVVLTMWICTWSVCASRSPPFWLAGKKINKIPAFLEYQDSGSLGWVGKNLCLLLGQM